MKNYLQTTQGRFIGVLVILVVILFVYYFVEMSKRDDAGGTKVVTVSETDHVRGAQAGTVTLVEFGDFQCPACGAYEPMVRQVTKDNPDTLKIVFKHFPLMQLHHNALLAAKASEAASNQGKFWEMHDILYDKQKEWEGTLNARDFFLTYATTIGLNTTQFLKDLDDPAIESKVLAEYKEGVNLGVNSTPTFFINGKKLDENPRSIEEFNTVIKAAASGQI